MMKLDGEKLTKDMIMGIVSATRSRRNIWVEVIEDSTGVQILDQMLKDFKTDLFQEAICKVLLGGVGVSMTYSHDCCGVRSVVWNKSVAEAAQHQEFLRQLTYCLPRLSPGFIWFKGMPAHVVPLLEEFGAQHVKGGGGVMYLKKEGEMDLIDVFLRAFATKKGRWRVRRVMEIFEKDIQEGLIAHVKGHGEVPHSHWGCASGCGSMELVKLMDRRTKS